MRGPLGSVTRRHVFLAAPASNPYTERMAKTDADDTLTLDDALAKIRGKPPIGAFDDFGTSTQSL